MSCCGTGMNIFRSEPMVYMQFVFPRDAAYASMKELGSAGIVHFKDLNPNVNQGKREYSGEIRRCNELKRSLRFFHSQLEKEDIKPDDVVLSRDLTMSELTSLFEELETDLKHLIQGEDDLNRHKIELIEMRYVLTIGQKFFEKTMNQSGSSANPYQHMSSSSLKAPEQSIKADSSLAEPLTGHLSSLAGIISQSKIDNFHRMIYVALRGNLYFESEVVPVELVDSTTQKKETKYVFMCFFSGEHAKNKIMRICSSYGASIYPFPATIAENEQQVAQIDERLHTMEAVQASSAEQKRARLMEIKAQFNSWLCYVAREKAVYHTLNMFSADNFAKCVVGEGWVPERSVPTVHMRLAAASTQAQSQVASMAHILNTNKTPPTHIRTTKFTSAYQSMVDAYGIANYREVNPALFCLFTFPFLFGVMFGDFAHGLLLALVGLVFCIFEKKLSKGLNDLIEYLYIGRYMILVMGLFASYCGLLYNECFSLSMNLFGSRYKCFEVEENHHTENVCHFIKGKGTYPFGVDPIWRQSSNNLVYTNSIKMKMSVILGVCHMTLGLFLSLLNHINKRSMVDVFCTFIPQFLLMMCLFGYMSFMIIYKWMTPVEGHEKPMLIRAMINMFLSIGQTLPKEERLFEGQEMVQLILVIVAVVSIVWLLVPKPIVKIIQHRNDSKKKESKRVGSGDSLKQPGVPRSKKDGGFDGYYGGAGEGGSKDTASSSSSSSSSSLPDYPLTATTLDGKVSSAFGMDEMVGSQKEASSAEEEEEEEFSVGEMCVHQLIEVIEYVLGCVSNTASYLRLWALSLAHGELAEVFFNYLVLVIGKLIPVVGLVIGAAGWLGATAGILLAMEGLSAFLHCLRLHWVEFQNKFYGAEGYAFVPLSFKVVDEEAGQLDSSDGKKDD
ncbi:putative ATPase V0 [Monocercomonoides exilis]|uniref:putative ATPase V0 n=1 Tax=Monocercomonoides exilis TaxID=2049356 RepID=UPI003559ED4D|nr:putative ATPase V0 [Monocercomonoides exilis]|eukprot:MONOS_11416.1-p1 / transcript=MONOS_11416.1 / gene=MONOS_11416 / organism=Monocercomonoides_exilis_PA203 / gene_product=ATPase V0 / transcript_product=ATPase V0 / location=Mono_scaffold00572:11731-15007(-) / protein_length=896 / sequence_SO=supercontig / SO=protein_coding / is_pseudo=false